MTQESPVVICDNCQTPIKSPVAQVRGEYYCDGCVDADIKRLRKSRG